MNKKVTISICIAVSCLLSLPSYARWQQATENKKYYGTALCSHPDYKCIKLTRGGSWASVFPDPHQRDLIQRVNRIYGYLPRGKVLAVPNNVENVSIHDVSPFPLNYEKNKGEKTVIVDQNKLAWAAYGRDGGLVKWGPISSGKDYCPDIGKGCRTLTGVFRFFGKQNSQCRSRTFGGARMPYCMFFHKGFAMHGSNDIPGRRASHGCIRMFTHDAMWMNHNFIEVSNAANNYKGTKVIVRELADVQRPSVKRNIRKRRNYVR